MEHNNNNKNIFEIIQSPLQIKLIAKIYRLSAVYNEQMKQK